MAGLVRQRSPRAAGDLHGPVQPQHRIGSPGQSCNQRWADGQRQLVHAGGCPSGCDPAVSPMPRPVQKRVDSTASREARTGVGPAAPRRTKRQLARQDACKLLQAHPPTCSCARRLVTGLEVERRANDPQPQTRTQRKTVGRITGVRTFFWRVYAGQAVIQLTPATFLPGRQIWVGPAVR